MKINRVFCKLNSYLNNNVNSELCPWKLERVSVRDNFDELSINTDRLIVYYFNIGLESTQHRVILEQV